MVSQVHLPIHSEWLVAKQTWLAVLEGGLNPKLGSSSELNPPITVLHRGRIREVEEEMGKRRDAGRIVAGMTQ